MVEGPAAVSFAKIVVLAYFTDFVESQAPAPIYSASIRNNSTFGQSLTGSGNTDAHVHTVHGTPISFD